MDVESCVQPDPKQVYAVWNKSEEIRFKSTSGGIFSALAKYVFSQSGLVFGAAFDKDLRLRHVKATSEQELVPLRKSKYIQSDAENAIVEAVDLLKQGKKVLFVGTPCQVAGLKKVSDRWQENLLTSDFICHGVASNRFFEKHYSWEAQRNNGKIVNVDFRDKSFGWQTCTGNARHDGTARSSRCRNG